MKKLMIVMGLFGVVLFGLDLQKVEPVAIVNSPNLKVSFENSKELKFVEAEPAQIILKIPIDIESIPANVAVDWNGYSYFPTSTQRMNCRVSGDTDTYYNSKEIEAGQSTITIKFNGISIEKLVKLNAYKCMITYDMTSGDNGFTAHAFPNEIFEIKKPEVSGSL